MKKNYVNVCVLFGLTLALAACPTGDGGGSGGPPSPQPAPIEHTLTSASDALVIKITETNTQPDIRAAISPVKGNYYWVFKSGNLINKGTITKVAGTTITFSGGFTLTLDGGNYTLSDNIPNSRPGGVSISGPISFTGSTSDSVEKSITITGYTAQDNEDNQSITARPMFLHSESEGLDRWPSAAYAVEDINGQTITYPLAVWDYPDWDDPQSPRWTGTGKFFIIIECDPPKHPGPGHDGSNYVYSEDGHNPTPVDIKSAETTLPWSKFIWLRDYTAG
jgi:hypothetical protein